MKYNFDGEEAVRFLGLAMVKVERKAPVKSKSSKVPKVSVAKSAFPIPYNGEFKDDCCYALRQNNGLYTQCTGLRKGLESFCKSCASTIKKTGAELPEYGTIQQRMKVGILDFVDPKGRSPTPYTKVMKKYKINEEEARKEAGKFNIIINDCHFVVPQSESKRGRPKVEKEAKAKGAKGRPKKEKKVLMIEGEEEDLFASLVAQANSSDDEGDITFGSKKKGKSDEEKEAKKLALEQAKAEKEAKLAAEKAEKEAKLAAEKAEKEAKKEQERLAREAKKQAEEEEKAAKKLALEQAKAEKEAKLAAEKAAKEAAKKPVAKKAVKVEEPEEDDEPDVVKKVEYEGKKYLKSKKTGIIYDYNEYVKNAEQVVVGKWNDTTNKIDFQDDGEESEEEYD
jgi:hypothetical protein